MKKILAIEYIEGETQSAVADEVNKRIRHWWQPFGQLVVVTIEKKIYYTQAIVQYSQADGL
jgi:hypothetical protein